MAHHGANNGHLLAVSQMPCELRECTGLMDTKEDRDVHDTGCDTHTDPNSVVSQRRGSNLPLDIFAASRLGIFGIGSPSSSLSLWSPSLITLTQSPAGDCSSLDEIVARSAFVTPVHRQQINTRYFEQNLDLLSTPECRHELEIVTKIHETLECKEKLEFPQLSETSFQNAPSEAPAWSESQQTLLHSNSFLSMTHHKSAAQGGLKLELESGGSGSLENTLSPSDTTCLDPQARSGWVAGTRLDFREIMRAAISGSPPQVNAAMQNPSDSQDGRAGVANGKKAWKGCFVHPGPAIRRKKRRVHRRAIDPNNSEFERQRLAHITVERNRRLQMNGHIAALKALMPYSSGFLKADQASVIDRTVAFVKELEVIQETLQVQRRRRAYARMSNCVSICNQPTPASGKPLDYGTGAVHLPPSYSAPNPAHHSAPYRGNFEIFKTSLDRDIPRPQNNFERRAEMKSSVATVEVKVVGNEAIVNIVAQWRPKQPAKVIMALESLSLSIVHARLTAFQKTNILYTFLVKVEPECNLTVNQVAVTLLQTFNLMHTIHNMGLQ